MCKRVQIFLDKSTPGKVIRLPLTWKELVNDIESKLKCSVHEVLTSDDAVIDDISLIRDNEKLFVKDVNKNDGNGRDVLNTSNEDILDMNDWIKLNVGGKYFITTRGSLVRTHPNSMLAKMFDKKNKWNNCKDEEGAVRIDRSPKYFQPILDYLRHGKIFMEKEINLKGVQEEASFFGLTSLQTEIERMLQEQNQQMKIFKEPLTRSMLIKSLLSVSTKCELRYQGIDFSGADLSKLDLRYINFKLAILRNCNLSQTDLSYASLERTDLSGAILDGANLQGARMICCIAERSSMIKCNFDDPTGLSTNMEGANLKGVNLEGSLMSRVNLRVATLKASNLRNCNLRGAILAGTDLEDCDLSGCDLKEANLRGCNVKRTKFREMLTPLHMTQSVP